MEPMKLACLLVAASLVSAGVPALGQVPPDRAETIRKAAPDRPRVKPKRPRTVLIFNTPPSLMDKDPHKGYCIPFGEEAFRAMGEKTGAYRPVVSDDVAELLPERIKRFDAIVLNNTSGAWTLPTQQDMARLKGHGDTPEAVEKVLRQSLLDYVRGGGGLVAVHFAIGANPNWPEFRELIGGRFTMHPWNEEVGIRVEEPGHPLVQAFGGKDFRLADEIYEFGDPYDRDKVRVLLSLDTAVTNMGVPWINRRDDDFAQAWVKPYGKGRVLNCGFGHRTEVWWNPAVLQFYLDAVQWACGDMAAPAAPRPTAASSGPPPGYRALFDGRTLNGWQGDRRIWSVRDGAITGQTTPTVTVSENSFLTYEKPLKDFDLRLKFKLEGGNSGIYLRSRPRAQAQTGGEALVGMQADFDSTGRWTGVIMEYTLRDVLAERGENVTIDEAGKRTVAGSLGKPEDLLRVVRPGEWNDYVVNARGGRVVLRINGVTMCALDDRDPRRLTEGLLGLQVHAGPPMTVQFKDIWLREL